MAAAVFINESMLGYAALTVWAVEFRRLDQARHFLGQLSRLSINRLKALYTPNGTSFGETVSSLWAMIWGAWLVAPMETFTQEHFHPVNVYIGETSWGSIILILGAAQWCGASWHTTWLRLWSSRLLFSLASVLCGSYLLHMPASLETLVYFLWAMSTAGGVRYLTVSSRPKGSQQPPS